MNDHLPTRRASDALLNELFRQSAVQHAENRDTLHEIKSDVGEIKTSAALIGQRVTSLEVWREKEAEPVIETVKSAQWMIKGAGILGGVGGVAGIAAAIKAFFFNAIGHP